jgi:methylmalonyl-CoA/ethylmalonyl-CoA epimerase
VSTTVLDHIAIGTRTLTDGWNLFGGLLGGTWVYGGDSAGFWWGQLQFASGPRIELIRPSSGPEAAFLERFLTSRGPGPHHLTFIVADINAILSRVRAFGIEPVVVRLDGANWKEAFLHPRDAHGIVIQIAQQSGSPRNVAPPAELPEPGPPSHLSLVEHHVADIESAILLFENVLDGEVVSRPGPGAEAELTWPNGARLRLVQTGAAHPARGGLANLHFTRNSAPFSRADLERATDLSHRLGTSLALESSLRA